MYNVIYEKNGERISSICFENRKEFESIVDVSSCVFGELIYVKDVCGKRLGFYIEVVSFEKIKESPRTIMLVPPSEELLGALADLVYSYERDCGDYKEYSHEVVIDWHRRLKGLSEKEIIEILSKISDDLDRAYEYGNESYG